MGYTTLETVKLYLDIPDEDENDDEILQLLIEEAQKVIETFCRQVFEVTEDSTKYFRLLPLNRGGKFDGRSLFLDDPLYEITTIVNGDGVAFSPTDYVTTPWDEPPFFVIELRQSTGVVWRPNSTYPSETVIAVVGKWGYSLSAPDDIRHATTRLAAWFYNQRKNSSDMDRTISVGDMTILPSRIPSDVYDLIKSYQRVV